MPKSRNSVFCSGISICVYPTAEQSFGGIMVSEDGAAGGLRSGGRFPCAAGQAGQVGSYQSTQAVLTQPRTPVRWFVVSIQPSR